MDLYFIAILPSDAVREQIKSLKEEIRVKYLSKRALRLPAHITLIPPFKIPKEQEFHLLAPLQELAQTQQGFELKLSGFGVFPPRVLFIEVGHCDPLIKLHSDLQEVMRQILIEPDQRNREFHPHITLATRDLDRRKFEEAWKDFQKREFVKSFKADSLVVFRHNGKTWDIYKQLPFNN